MSQTHTRSERDVTWSWRSLGRGARPAFIALLLLVLIGLVAAPSFATSGNLVNLLRQMAPLGVLAIGQTIVLIAGGIDLSVGMLVGLTVPLGALAMAGSDGQILPAILLMLAVGALVGMANGLLVAWAGVHPFVLTFGMMALLQGTTFLVTDYRTVGQTAPGFADFFAGGFAFPSSVWLLIALAAATAFMLRFTRYGHYLYATGSHAVYARRAGLHVRRITFIAYLLSGLFAAGAGVLVLGRLQAGYPLAGSGYELDAIVAAVLGGAAFAGGQGGVVGALGGAAVLAMMSNLLNLLGVSAYVQQILKGLIIIAVIGLRIQVARKRGRSGAWTRAKTTPAETS